MITSTGPAWARQTMECSASSSPQHATPTQLAHLVPPSQCIMQISMTCLLVAELFLYSPSRPHTAAIKLHSLLQQFAWTEAEVRGGVPSARTAEKGTGLRQATVALC